MDNELLGGDVALDLAELLLKSCQTGLNRLLLGDRRREKRLHHALIGNFCFLGASLCCAKVGCVKVDGDGDRPFFRTVLRMSSVSSRSILRWRRVGCFMIEPPKLSPFSGTDDAYYLTPFGKASGQHATGCEVANPVRSLFSSKCQWYEPIPFLECPAYLLTSFFLCARFAPSK